MLDSGTTELTRPIPGLESVEAPLHPEGEPGRWIERGRLPGN